MELSLVPAGQTLAISAICAQLGLPDEGREAEGGSTLEVGRAATGATLILERAGQSPDSLARVRVPTVRAPTFANDALGPILDAIDALGGRLDPEGGPPRGGQGDLSPEDSGRWPQRILDHWWRERRRVLAALIAVCEQTGAPPPPHLPRSELDALHAWLLVSDEAAAAGEPVAHPVVCLDPRDGAPVRVAIALPAAGPVLVIPGLDLLLGATGSGEARTGDTGPRVLPSGALPAGERRPDGLVHVALDEDQQRALSVVPGDELARYRMVAPVEVIDDEALWG